MKFKSLVLIMSSALAISGCGGSSGDKSTDPGTPSLEVTVPTTGPGVVVTVADPTATAASIKYNDIAVHDPSVIKVGSDYYVFGSHLAVAKSTDLMKWDYTSVLSANDKVDESTLFNTYSSQFAEGIAWTDGFKGSWAPDVIKASNGKYWFYYNHCAQSETTPAGGCWNRSYLGLAESDSVTGPYVNKGILLRSGYRNAGEFTTYPLDNGQATYNPAVDPNVIDPHAFYDKAGKLWLVYGSYSGGIFIIELDAATGKAKAGQGYGKHLAGGGFAAIEGTWITYSPETDYYYMFNSIAGFAANDGYNIRVSRSKTPNGTYVDAAGNDMLLAKNDIATLSKYGVKLMGGFNFVAERGDASGAWGYLSPGHNSVYYDSAAKKYFLVTHTRFPNRGEEHSVRVHEMFLNADGWFVASPQRYAPIAGDNVVDAVDLVGDYRFINHGRDSNTVGHNSQYIRLNADYTITGAVTGTYHPTKGDNKRITLKINATPATADQDAVDGYTAEGVMAWQWDDVAKKLTPTFTALSTSKGGISIWGVKMQPKTATQVFTDIAASLTLPTKTTDTAVSLPTRGERNAEIVWSTNNAAISTTGVVTRPNVGAGDASVTVTATIKYDGSQSTKTFTVVVPQRVKYNRVAQFDFESNLTESLNHFAAATTTGDRIFKAGGTPAYLAGHTGQSINLDSTYGVLLPEGLIASNNYTVSYWVKPTVITGFSPIFFASTKELTDGAGLPYSDTWVSFLAQSWNGGTMLWGRVPDWFDGITSVKIPEASWTHMAFSVKNGLARVFINGVETTSKGGFGDLFSANKGKFALGVNYWDIPFNGQVDDLKIYESSLVASEVKALDVDNLPASQLLTLAVDALTLGDISELKSDIVLPVTGPFASSVQWTSSNSAVISTSGKVTQPGAGQSNATVTLTATIGLEGAQSTKTFTALVKANTPAKPSAVYSFEGNLTESANKLATGTVTGNLIPAAGGTASYTAGPVGKALVLDGASGVKLADNLIVGKSYSISMWLNPSALTNYTTAFFGFAKENYWISVVPGGGPGGTDSVLWSGSTNWFDGKFGSTIPKDKWTHVVMVVNKADLSSGVLTVYLNGKKANSLVGFPDVFSSGSTSTFFLGVNYWDTPYKGMIDELKIFNEAISASDVTLLYGESK